MRQNGDSQAQHGQQQGSAWLEWFASGLGLILAVGCIGYLLWEGVTSGDQPPSVQIDVQRISRNHAGYLVEIRAANRSGNTAATVLVEGELTRDGRTLETSETTFDYIPGHSERQGGLYFVNDPRELQLEVRPKGYVQP